MLARTRIAVASGTAALLSRHRSVAELLSGGEALGGSADEEISNWSATHSAMPSLYFEPDSTDAVGQVIAFMHAAGQKLRVVGSALSPNGIGLSDGAMINMAQCSKILSVDPERRQVTVQAGARVSEVVEALRPHGLTLQNYASIAEQQIGGFVQVGAHGTGAAIPPVDEQVVSMRLITPALGEICLSEADNPRLFRLARVGLGALGVVSEALLPLPRTLPRSSYGPALNARSLWQGDSAVRAGAQARAARQRRDSRGDRGEVH